jgi:hypothetical protein
LGVGVGVGILEGGFGGGGGGGGGGVSLVALEGLLEIGKYLVGVGLVLGGEADSVFVKYTP